MTLAEFSKTGQGHEATDSRVSVNPMGDKCKENHAQVHLTPTPNNQRQREKHKSGPRREDGGRVGAIITPTDKNGSQETE